MKTDLKELIKKALYFTGYYSLYRMVNAPPTNRLLILMYHTVVRDEDKLLHWYHNDPPSESQLEAVIIALKKRFRLLTVSDAMREIRDGGKLLEPSVAITFDDGYLSNYEIAFPLLKRYGISATIYLPTDWIDGNMTLWWTELTALVDGCTVERELLREVEAIVGKTLPLSEYMLSDPRSAKEALHEQLGIILMRKDDESRTTMLDALRNLLGSRGAGSAYSDASMSWHQIKEMADYGIEFGAHTCSHPNLSYVDLERAEREIVESRRILRERIKCDVPGFAYPYGYDVEGYKRFAPIFKKHDFLYAATSWWGYVDQNSDPFRLRRTGLPLTLSQAVLARSLALEYCRNDWPIPEGTNLAEA